LVSIEDVDYELMMKYGSEDEKMVLTEAIKTGNRLSSEIEEILFGLTKITKKIASKTHVFFGGMGQSQFISGRTLGKVNPIVHVAKEEIFYRPMGLTYREDLDENLVKILNQM